MESWLFYSPPLWGNYWTSLNPFPYLHNGDNGLQLGLTVREQKNRMPATGWTLGRASVFPVCPRPAEPLLAEPEPGTPPIHQGPLPDQHPLPGSPFYHIITTSLLLRWTLAPQLRHSSLRAGTVSYTSFVSPRVPSTILCCLGCPRHLLVRSEVASALYCPLMSQSISI